MTLRRRLRRIIVLVVIGLLAYAAASYVAAVFMTSRRQLIDPYAPREVMKYLDEERLRTDDGLELMAWAIEPAGDVRGAVVLMHGLGGARQGRRLGILRDVGLAGYAIDHRAHGDSEGEQTSFGWEERRDVIAAVARARERWPDARIGLWGTSMGGAACCFAADAIGPVHAIVLESVYSTMEIAWENRLKDRLPDFMVPLGKGPQLFVEWRLGVPASEISPSRFIHEFGDTPILAATGAQDPWTPPEELDQLIANARRVEAVTVPGLKHEDLLADHDWKKRVTAFFVRHLLEQ